VSLSVLKDELTDPIDELNPFVVVTTEELKDPIDELTPEVVVATDELKELIDKVKPLVVVAIDELRPEVVTPTLELNSPTLVDILELNVEYPVVPVIST
jgi:hypothetical protein